MKVFISAFVLERILVGSSKKKVVNFLEKRIENGDSLYSSIPSVLRVWEKLDFKDKERAFFHLIQELVTDLIPLDSSIFELITLRNPAPIPNDLYLEILLAYQSGMEEFLIGDQIDLQSLPKLRLTFTQVF